MQLRLYKPAKLNITAVRLRSYLKGSTKNQGILLAFRCMIISFIIVCYLGTNFYRNSTFSLFFSFLFFSFLISSNNYFFSLCYLYENYIYKL